MKESRWKDKMLKQDDDVVRAIKLAGEAHKNDLWGEYPYMVHLAITAHYAQDYGVSPVPALLHDVIEDHPEFLERIEKEFPEWVEVLLLLSRRDDETYNEYITRLILSENVVALKIKLSDLKCNRGNNPPGRLIARYDKATERVSGALMRLGGY